MKSVSETACLQDRQKTRVSRSEIITCHSCSFRLDAECSSELGNRVFVFPVLVKRSSWLGVAAASDEGACMLKRT
jgi:hypothetical protein